MNRARDFMKTKHTTIIILASCILLTAVVLPGTVGCRRQTVTHSMLSGSSGGRSASADIDGPAAIFPQEDKIIIKMKDHAIVIERERLLVDEKERAKIPADAKKFDVKVAGGTLTVTADDAEILKAPLNR